MAALPPPLRRILLLTVARLVWGAGSAAGWLCLKCYRAAGRLRGWAVCPGRPS